MGSIVELVSVLVRRGCHKKIPQTGCLKQRKLIFSWYWRLEVLDQGTGRFSFWVEFSFWVADRKFPFCHVLTWTFLCGHIERKRETWREGDIRERETEKKGRSERDRD